MSSRSGIHPRHYRIWTPWLYRSHDDSARVIGRDATDRQPTTFTMNLGATQWMVVRISVPIRPVEETSLIFRQGFFLPFLLSPIWRTFFFIHAYKSPNSSSIFPIRLAHHPGGEKEKGNRRTVQDLAAPALKRTLSAPKPRQNSSPKTRKRGGGGDIHIAILHDMLLPLRQQFPCRLDSSLIAEFLEVLILEDNRLDERFLKV